MTQFMEVCLKAVCAGGQVLRDMRGRINPREKAPKDLVTEADLASQEAIYRVISRAFPSHGFVGEEGSPGEPHVPGAGNPGGMGGPEYCWVVDPLDGTLNYVRQLPNYSVSVALRRGPDVVCGAVYDPILDECFAAAAGRGATLNGSPIRCGQCTQVEQALIAASLPVDVPRGSAEVARFIEVMHSAQSIRRLGSAALSLCYVAMGRMDAYWAMCVKQWDVAAGQLILREAGGVISGPTGGVFDLDHPQFVAAATPPLHRELLDILRRVS